MKKLTIFTPTYNRAYILPQLYNSLTRQTDKNFCWLVVDDGSTDETELLFNKWVQENLIDIKYIKQVNGGKMRAHNTGVKACDTDLFVCVDSDDYVVDDAVENILDNYKNWETRYEISGMIAYKGKKDNNLLSSVFPKGVKIITLGDLYRKGFSGDTTLVYRTKILQEYLFPEIVGEKFVTEDYVYCQIDEKYKMILNPKIITICEYLQDGYTKNAIRLIVNNPKGMLNYYNLKIVYAKSIKERALYVIRYTAFAKLCGGKHNFKNCKSKFLYIFCLPVSYCYYFNKKNLLKAE